MASRSLPSNQPGLPEVRVTTRAQWRAWLAKHHTQPDAIWLASPRKTDPEYADLTYDAVVEEALCFGWIDSVARKSDGGWGALRLSPRRPGSGWSRSNKIRIERLAAAGLLMPAGLAAIEAAKADGSWTALDAVEALEVPDDLARALKRNAAARRHFDAFPPGARKLILGWIASAKRPETRATRVAETVRLAAENVRANQPPRAR